MVDISDVLKHMTILFWRPCEH